MIILPQPPQQPRLQACTPPDQAEEQVNKGLLQIPMLLVYAMVKEEKGPLKRTEQRQQLTKHSKISLTFLNGE